MSESRPASPNNGRRSQPPPSPHYDATQLRTETWNRLKNATERLEEARLKGRDGSEYVRQITECLSTLRPIETFWAFPGKHAVDELLQLFDRRENHALARHAARLESLMVSDAYRNLEHVDTSVDTHDVDQELKTDESVDLGPRAGSRPYFEVLVVDALSTQAEAEIRRRLLELRREDDEFIYDVVFSPSFEDAIIAVLFNHNIQSCVIRHSFPYESSYRLDLLQHYLNMLDRERFHDRVDEDRSLLLGEAIASLRPELDLFLVTDAPVEDMAGNLGGTFRRAFYRQEDYLELHLSILKGIAQRFETPFFTALRSYSQKPTGGFHALPIARGKSIAKSHWIKDLEQFFGVNMFQAESSATSGGLDSLLQPVGPIKTAQQLAARAFGAKRTYFVTNGTSTANKIVVQALVRPGDIVLCARDCHKSHHYALLLVGAYPVYLDAYPLSDFSMYGAVPLRDIKRYLLDLRRAGKLDRVKMLLLTSCTFDGIVYDPFRVMEEVLAIKPDIVFVWDEAWYAFARFNPTLRRRTAMEAAERLRERYRSADYREHYAKWRAEFDKLDPNADATWLDRSLLPDPHAARIRVYATQSTHKTLTAMRQGSMIHVRDQDFEQRTVDDFNEAYMSHTSTSPNYPILASLDVGRRQVELEGYELVRNSIELAMRIRRRVRTHPLIQKYFHTLGATELIPREYRPSGIERYYLPEVGWTRMEDAWRTDEFTVDPTRITLHIAQTGLDGDTFKTFLMDRHDIQVNKTSRNTVLIMIHIGMTRGTVAYLIEVLTKIAMELEERLQDQSKAERRGFEKRVDSLTNQLPPLPNFSRFHCAFLPKSDENAREGDLRRAFFEAYDEEKCDFLPLNGPEMKEIEHGREYVSASFVTPYPPGFPILVPGQVISSDILAFLRSLDVREIHGYAPEYGLRVFTNAALDELIQADARRRSNIGAAAAP